MRLTTCALFIAGLLISAGCGEKRPPTVQRPAPEAATVASPETKESDKPAETKPVAEVPAPAEPAEERWTGKGVSWVLPKEWVQRPGAGMRTATITAGKGNAAPELSVIKLGAFFGGLRANINRWRGQIGLGPVSEDELEPLLTRTDVSGTRVIITHLKGESAHMLAAIFQRRDSTWFFKMKGHGGDVMAQKATFMKFVQTVRF